MTEKPDYYTVLGVAKDASVDDIKRAHKAIIMKNHPDVVKRSNPSKEVIEAAAAKVMAANDAVKVLTDPTMRAAYDKYGHKGVENLGAGKNAASGQSYADVAGPIVQRKMPTTEDTMEFFEKRAAQRQREDTGAPDDGLTSDQRRERARQERLNRRKTGDAPPATPTTPEHFDSASSSNAFRDVADKVSTASDALRGGVALPVDVLVKFRENLADFLGEVDKAIARAKAPGGPGFR